MKKLLCRIVKYIVDILNEIFTWCHTTIAAPTLLTATFDPPDIDLVWVDNADNNTCFNIWRSTDGTNFILIDTIGDLEGYTDTTATPGVNYWYKVQACDGSGNTSDFSNIVETEELFTEINYGLLYNWWVASAANIAPAGWHVPSEAEWNTLITFAGGTLVAGGKCKEIGTTYWNSDSGATNEYGFNSRGSGHRTITGIFENIKKDARYQSSTQQDATRNRSSYILELTNAMNVATVDKIYGSSIRLLKDDAVNDGAVVDYDGNVYPTVIIGTQVWMAQNLIVKHYNDGTPIPEVTDAATWAGLGTGAWCYYDNDPDNM